MLDLERVFSPAHMKTEFPETPLSDSDIVPDEVQNELIRWRDVFSAGAFNIGDIANKMIERASGQGWVVTNDRIYRAVGKFCGKSGRTIRYYAETSAFYPANIRNKFEVLPFSHFVFARTKCSEWETVLEYAAENPEKSLSEVMAHFNETRVTTESHIMTGISVSASYSDGVEMREVSQNYYPTQQARAAVRINAVGDLLTALDRFERVLPELRIEDENTLSDLSLMVSELRNRARNLTVTRV